MFWENVLIDFEYYLIVKVKWMQMSKQFINFFKLNKYIGQLKMDR